MKPVNLQESAQSLVNEQTLSSKPELIVNLDGPAPGSLSALSYLSALKTDVSYHKRHDRRHPLGIYNVSILRICEKICRCSAKLENYFLLPPQISEIDKCELLRDELLDSLELCLYAAAEHIDDVELIGLSFFETPEHFKKSPQIKALNRAVKPFRESVTSVINTIKHQQGRLRLYTLEVNHGGIDMCLHGFYVEGFVDGAVGPSSILYDNGNTISSATSILWNPVIYIGMISKELSTFICDIVAVDESRECPVGSVHFRDAVVALARLPLYSFDEVHPFATVRLVLNTDGELEETIQSGIYGSITQTWSENTQIRFGNHRYMMAGDGASKKFTLPLATSIQLQRWT